MDTSKPDSIWDKINAQAGADYTSPPVPQDKRGRLDPVKPREALQALVSCATAALMARQRAISKGIIADDDPGAALLIPLARSVAGGILVPLVVADLSEKEWESKGTDRIFSAEDEAKFSEFGRAMGEKNLGRAVSMVAAELNRPGVEAVAVVLPCYIAPILGEGKNNREASADAEKKIKILDAAMSLRGEIPPGSKSGLNFALYTPWNFVAMALALDSITAPKGDAPGVAAAHAGDYEHVRAPIDPAAVQAAYWSLQSADPE